MVDRLIEPARFMAEGRSIDWELAFLDRPGEPVDVHVILKNLGLPAQMNHLRWAFNADPTISPSMGMPTEPFTVWHKPSFHDFQNLPTSLPLVPQELGGHLTAYSWGVPVTHLRLDFDPSTPFGVPVVGVSGGPGLESAVATSLVTSNAFSLLTGAALTGVIVPSGTQLGSADGLLAQDYAQDPGWKALETVGLPVDPATWTGPVAGHAINQGLAGKLTTPAQAAVERLFRAILLYGWDRELEPGVLAPPWQPPSPQPLVKEVNADLLPLLKSVLGAVPSGQITKTATVPVSAPTNPAGTSLPGSVPANATVVPLALLLTAVTTDPFLAVALGFGTAHVPPELTLANPGVISIRPTTDYMVTAHYAHGLSGADSGPVEYAAIVPSPGEAQRSPAPAKQLATQLGVNRPAVRDAAWTTSTSISWDRLPRQGLLGVRDFAAVRRVAVPKSAPVPLMENRPSGGFRPIAANDYHPGQASSTRLSATDRVLNLPLDNSVLPVDYFVAQSDLFGRWGHWSRASCVHKQPAVQHVPILAASLTPSVPASGTVCPATLTVQLSWDWTGRAPRRIRLVGRLYAALQHGDPPTDLSVPDGLQRSVGSGTQPVDLVFEGDVASIEGGGSDAVVEYLSEDGEGLVAPGSAQGTSRRYRVKIPGLSVSFGGTPHVAAALWAAGIERVSVDRKGEFSEHPTIVTASNPIPPVVSLEPVTLASLPDSTGSCHARISWGVAPGATGYFLYTATESAMLAVRPPLPPGPPKTLVQRRKILEDFFVDNPSRREFTRVNASPLTITSSDVKLPRGTADIHAYVVVGVNASGLESTWPAPEADEVAQKLILVAAPQVAVPVAPTLEVQRVPNGSGFGAGIAIGSRPGAVVERIDLHRVRVTDAAADVNTMGPPVAVIAGSSADWSVTKDAAQLLRIAGQDRPEGSWRRVYYRAVAWAGDDLARGILGTRSPASPPVSVVLPPGSPPDLSAVTVQTLPNSAPDALFTFSTEAPLNDTPVGPHRLAVEAKLISLPATSGNVLTFSSTLRQVPTAPPQSGRSGVARVGEESQQPVKLAAVVRRPSENDGVSAIVRLTDPLGRVTERLVTVPAGPTPDVSDLALEAVADPGAVLRWTTKVPMVPIVGGAYRVRITATPPAVGGKPGRPLVLDVPVPDVGPIAGPPPAGLLVVQRAVGDKVPHAFRATCRTAVASFTVRITAPDGRTAESTRKVP